MPRPIPALVSFALLCACAQDLESSGPPAPTPPATDSSPRALFAEYPDLLLEAVAASCEGPGRRVVRPEPGEVRCEGLPPVEAAASLILQYDGIVEDLPRYVSSIAVGESDAGYLVTADTYIRVPQRSGELRIVRLPDPELEALIRDVFLRAGGAPV